MTGKNNKKHGWDYLIKLWYYSEYAGDAVSDPVMPFDMFPRTANTETLVELRLRRL